MTVENLERYQDKTESSDLVKRERANGYPEVKRHGVPRRSGGTPRVSRLERFRLRPARKFDLPWRPGGDQNGRDRQLKEITQTMM
jgi:hypothetical protein